MKILIVYHSGPQGNTEKLAKKVAEGAGELDAAEVVLRRVEEAEAQECVAADAIILGSSNRFGGMSAKMKAFVETWAPEIWLQGKLIGKVGAAFCTSGTLHCGKEMALMSLLTPLIHHGMYVVGVPEIHAMTAGSCYGAAATTPRGSTGPSEQECAVARELGRRVAELAAKVLAP